MWKWFERLRAPRFPVWPANYVAAEFITGRTFVNERVLLDDRRYEDCTFNNVTLHYNGTTPVQFSNNHLHTPILFDSDNPAVKGTLVLLQGLGYRLPTADDPPLAKLPDAALRHLN